MNSAGYQKGFYQGDTEKNVEVLLVITLLCFRATW